jgi:hypothetical protein
MDEEQFGVARELQEIDGIEDVYFNVDTLRARVKHGEDGMPDKSDFPEALEQKILQVIEGTSYEWPLHKYEYGEFRAIEHAGSGHPMPYGPYWYVVLYYEI